MTRRFLLIPAFLMMVCCGARLAAAQDPFIAFQNQDYATALKGFQELASQGNANAMNNLGLMYSNGLGVTADQAKAIDWYNQAASKGHLGAVNNLGGMYEMGQGVAQNYTTAAEKYALAAKYGLTDAQYNLAALYEAGKGVQNDPLQAYIWYSLAAAMGDPDAAVGRDRMAQVLDPTLRRQADEFAASWKPSK
ncbi:MAG TPA: tetratricopeptide repeat protein [Dongiaceae bacterium]|nr:tetratricopeptide repeat protein [Dongiaceae bacterium]